jgi:hypothetical protein
MAKRKPRHQPEELPDLTGRQAGRFPWDGYTEQQLQAMEEAHARARCLVSRGYGAVRWGRHCGSSTGSLFDDI